LLLGALDASLGITELFRECIFDERQESKVDHSVWDLVRQRVFSIACGYTDCNDATHLRTDAMQKALAGRDPVKGEDLASQPTLSRFENSVTAGECFRLGICLAERVIERHRKRLGSRKVRQITLDFDGSADPTHGSQQLSLFNNYYGSWCYFPLFGFVSFNQEPEQYLIAALLRSGHATETEGTLGILRRIVPYLQDRFPRARIQVRLDAGFRGPALFDLLDELGVEYVVGIAKNSVLSKASAGLMRKTHRDSARTGETVQRYGDTLYSAKSWRGTERRVVFKAECLQTPGYDAKDNERYVVTNLDLTPRNVYRVYCQRGSSENRLKELKNDLEVDRTSCHRVIANQFRLLLVTAAYILFQELRLRASRTNLGNAQVSTLRLALLKIGGVVKSSVRRITFHLSASHPWIDVWRRIARRCHGVLRPVTA
jgi:hypothetical protein